MSRPTVLLFDIDGTLMLSGGAGRRAIERAFERFCGRPDATDQISYGGMTDRAIARQGLRLVNHPADDQAIDAVLEHYLEFLREEIPASTGYRILPGVHALVEAVSGRTGVAVGLGTGNLKRGAEIKLARAGLFGAFSFGGFSCDHEERPELLRIGARRGAQVLGHQLEACRVVVIGDTPKDVSAALAIGAECVGVATGGIAAEVLLEHGAHHAFADMSAAGMLDVLLG